MGGEQHQPSDFGEILSGPDFPLIVGGQAVNLWAEVYADACPALAEFNPFLSKDADIVGTKDSAAALAKRAGWRCDFLNQRDSIVVAILTKEGGGIDPPTVEVLSEVNGLSSEPPADRRAFGSRIVLGFRAQCRLKCGKRGYRPPLAFAQVRPVVAAETHDVDLDFAVPVLPHLPNLTAPPAPGAADSASPPQP